MRNHPNTPSPRHNVTGLLFVVVLVSGNPTQAAEPTDAEQLFTLQVLPLLQEKCFGCHGKDPDDIRGEFDLLTREGMLKGGESGEPSIVPGKPQESSLYLAVLWEGYEMPPKENDRLTAEQTEFIREWIAAGAPWPDREAQEKIREAATVSDGATVRTSGGTSDEWTNRTYDPEDLWAFVSVRPKSELMPRPVSTTEAVDFFIDQQLTAAGLEPAPSASPRTLIRRASFDLTGLPPAPDEIDAFEVAYAADSQQAWADLIDRLLESPRYGEHWARHWLDVTRYADTGGMSNDYERSNMWRYRDYVIRAFNDDKPYNEFVVEQLAGDELVDQSVRERSGASLAEVHQAQLGGDYTPQEAEWIIATGFLRLGPWTTPWSPPKRRDRSTSTTL